MTKSSRDFPVPEPAWAMPPHEKRLGQSDVHVWSALLDLPAAEIERLARILCPAEEARAARFRLERDRHRFIARRGILRRLVGDYLALDPRDVAFAYDARDKPSLATVEGTAPIQFNLSDSAGLALYAITRSVPPGVDVERIRTMTDANSIAKRFFSTLESGALAALSGGDQSEAFFRCWTRKEAYLKATGEGIAESLSRVEVSFLPGEPPQISSIAGDQQAGAAWTVYELTPASGFTGAVAIKAKDLKLSCWRWPGDSTE